MSMVMTSCPTYGGRYQQAVQKDFKTVVVLAVLAVVLVVSVLAAAAVNPYALIGLPAVLFAVAAVVRAVGGRRNEDDRREHDHGQKAPKTLRKASRTDVHAGQPRGR